MSREVTSGEVKSEQATSWEVTSGEVTSDENQVASASQIVEDDNKVDDDQSKHGKERQSGVAGRHDDDQIEDDGVEQDLGAGVGARNDRTRLFEN